MHVTLKSLLLTGLAVNLGGCALAPETRVLLAQPQEVAVRAATSVQSVEIRELDLPYYAQGDEIAVRNADGAVQYLDKTFWADLPPRALTLRVAETLSRVLPGVTVAAEPWPLLSRPELRVEVQVSELLGSLGGDYIFTGQYFIVADAAGTFEMAQPFAITVPVAGIDTASLGAAQSTAVEQLAGEIADTVAAITRTQLRR